LPAILVPLFVIGHILLILVSLWYHNKCILQTIHGIVT